MRWSLALFWQGLVAETDLSRRLPPVTTDMINLRNLVESSPDTDLLREMTCLAAERLTKMEVGAGTIELRTPKPRKGSYLPRFPRAAADGRLDRVPCAS